MPKINRVRIVNFSYNDNNRHIVDELFDFYGGENALLSLSNGGGKSVLVQVMLQPILPKATLLGRKFADFFRGRKTPSYIMTEWKLDDDAGYLLTGIAVTGRSTQSANDEEEISDIRYFTFISGYESANPFDIKNIPVSEQTGSSLKIAIYGEFKKLLEKESGKNHRELEAYDSTREDQNRYERKLNSYGISREEWRELIIKINEAENGVSEVFSECKTSRKVMEQWVIKYIEKVLNKSSDGELTDHKKLETMMAQVAQSLVDNENHIKEYKAIESFNGKISSIYSEINVVLQHLDNEAKLKKEIASGYQVLKNEEKRLEQELHEIEERLRELTIELENIQLEEKSSEIYKYNLQIEEVDSRLAELEKQKNTLTESQKEKKDLLALQQAAEKYGRVIEKEKEIARLQQSLDNASRDQEELLRNLNIIKYSLKSIYEKELEGTGKNIDELEAGINNIAGNIESGRKQASLCQNEIDKLNIQIGGISSKLVSFEKEEAETLSYLGVQIYRNPLLKELDKNDIIKAKAQLSQQCREAEASHMESVNAEKMITEKISSLEQKRRELAEIETLLKIEETKINGRISDWEADRQRLLEAMKRLNIGEDHLFDTVYLVREAKSYLNDWENKAYNLRMEISEMDKQIHGIKNGVSYLPPRLVALLEEHNLPCFTGEKYLREIGEEEKRNLIAQNPLLPYSIIATEKEIAQIERIAADKDFSQIVPVLRYNSKGQKPEQEYGDVHFIAAAANISIDNASLETFIAGLLNNKDLKVLELEKAIEVIERINGDYQIITGFEWTRQKVDQMLAEKTAADEKIAENKNTQDECFAELEKAKNLKADLEERISELKDQLKLAQDKLKEFELYLDKNSEYMNNVKKYDEIQGLINNYRNRIRKIEEEGRRLEKQAQELHAELANKRNAKTETEKKLLDVADATESEVMEGSIQELEGRLEACRKQQKNEVAVLNEQINGLNKDIKGIEKEIGKIKPPSEEYKSILYSENIELDLENQCSSLEKEIDGIKTDESNERNERARLDERVKMLYEALGGRPPVPVENIRGNFKIRRQAVNNENEEKKARNREIQQEKIYLAKLFSKIEAVIREVGGIKAGASTKSYITVKTEISRMIDEYMDLKDKSNKSIDTFSKNSSEFISSFAGYEEGTVREAVKGIKSQIDTLDRSYDKYYYLAERLEYYQSQLAQILRIMENKMQQLEHSRNDLTEHAFLEARRIYHEIPKISENSAVEIDGIRKRVLEIDYEEMENEIQAREKMAIYINDCLEGLTRLIKDNEDENKLRREIEKFMSTKELLNVISRLENCRIKAYKVDLNEKNRKMMPWEDIIVKNSGGEKFVAYFSLLVALISYSRKQIKGNEAFRRKEESKVLLMDNPFGPITSGHLLKPMFDIAKKYNTQLICLSDIKQGSVLNSFDLIYMIKIKQNLMQEDFLELEPVLLRELKQDEKLENAHLYGKIQQLSLFD